MVRKYSPIVVFTSDEIRKIQSVANVTTNTLGDMGEAIIEYGLKWFFWQKNFKLGKFKNNTFSLIRHYKADKISGTGGIDFYLKFRMNWRTYRIFIEVKNWDDWLKYPDPHVSDERYNGQILSRFTDYDKMNLCHRVLVIQKGYISNLKSRCNQDKITIIPLLDYYIPQIHHESFCHRNIMHFINDFSVYINSIIPRGIATQPIGTGIKTKTDRIWADLRKGMPPGLVVLIHNTSSSYVYRVKSERRKGINKYIYRY